MVTVTVNLSDGLANLGELPKQTITEGLQQTAQCLIGELMQKSPVDHGLLRQWAVTSQSDTEITIQSPAEYAAFQNYGTSKHFIKPVNAKALHWDGYFSKGHMVGGITGKHFVEESIDATMPRIQEFFTIKGG